MQEVAKRRLPKYRIIETDLLSMIRGGQVTVGQQVPTEISISKKYQVSRPTARKALGNLETKGYLRRIPGRGSFVENWKQNSNNHSNLLRKNIAMLTVDTSPEHDEENWDIRLLRAASYEAEELGYHITLCGVSSEQIIKGNLPLAIREKTACGAIVDGHKNDMVIRQLIASEVPLLLVGSHRNAFGLPEVYQDIEDALYKITSALLGLNRGPVWMIDTLTEQSYHPAQMCYKGYQRAIFDQPDPRQLLHLNQCTASQCKRIIEQVAQMDARQHCMIILNLAHFRSILDNIKRAGLDMSDFTFVNIGRFHKGWHDKGEFMFCEFEPSMIAREAVRQIAAYAEGGIPLKTRHLKLKIEKLGDVSKPFKFSWI